MGCLEFGRLGRVARMAKAVGTEGGGQGWAGVKRVAEGAGGLGGEGGRVAVEPGGPPSNGQEGANRRLPNDSELRVSFKANKSLKEPRLSRLNHFRISGCGHRPEPEGSMLAQ